MDNRCILIIDDDPTDTALYESWLGDLINELNLQVISCDNIHEGLVKYATKQPQCVLLDYQMAQGDGLEFLATLKAQSVVASPIIFLTAYAQEELKNKGFEGGIQFFISKDELDATLLTQKVRDVIELSENELLRTNNAIQSSLTKMIQDA